MDTRIRRGLIAALATVGLLGLAPSATAHGAEEPPPNDALVRPVEAPAAERGSVHPNLAASLDDEATGPGSESVPNTDADADGDGIVTVVVESSDPTVARAAVDRVGGSVDLEAGGLVQAEVPSDALIDLAGANGVDQVREPLPLVADATSEGVADTGATAWQGTYTGTGTTVAVVDVGFASYAANLGSELPASVATDFSRCGGSPGADTHGTAVAEIVHDMAPDAGLRLICVDTDLDLIDALDTLPAAVDIVNGSIGVTLAGRGDGSGALGAAVERARTRGVLYVASAGNYGGSHHHQSAVGDSPGYNFDDFVNLPGGDDALNFWVAPGGTVDVSLKWDGWPTTRQDFDLYLVTNASGIVAASEFDQATAPGDDPVEYASVTNSTGAAASYFVVINRFSGSGTPRLDLYFDGNLTSLESPTTSDLSDPATSNAAMSAGAYCEANGTLQPYSSQGPTIDGRTKPDIAGPDGTSSSVYGAQSGCFNGFTGTSAAAPHVAGAAALLWDANPDLDVAEVQRLLEDRAQDAGATGLDNQFGAGRLRLGAVGDTAVDPAQPFTGMTPVRLFDSRAGTQFPGESPNRTTPLGPNGKVRIRVRGYQGVPADATAVVLNVTAVSPSQSGWFTVHPGGTVPNASNVNFTPGQNVAVHVTATVNPSDDKIELVNAVGSTHAIVDIAGWYGPTGSGGAATERFTPLAAPARALDSRVGDLGYAEAEFGVGGRTTPIPGNGTLSVKVAGLGGIPSDATAVAMNVTAVAPSSGTFLTAYPDGDPLPDTSSLNAKAGQVVANLVIMPVGDDGRVTFYNQKGNTHLVIDSVGWYQSGAGAGYVALDPPTRLLDTRSGTGLRLGALTSGYRTHVLEVGARNGVPADAAAVMLGVIGISPSQSGWLTVYPGDSAVPETSTLNFTPGTVVPNAAIAGIGGEGTVAFNNPRGSTHVASDLFGYFIDPDEQP